MVSRETRSEMREWSAALIGESALLITIATCVGVFAWLVGDKAGIQAALMIGGPCLFISGVGFILRALAGRAKRPSDSEAS